MNDAQMLLLWCSLASLGMGLAGSWLGWRLCTLRLKSRMDALEEAHEALSGRHLAAVKRAAGKEGLDQRARNKEIEELARKLPTEIKVAEVDKPWWETVEKGRDG
jgi:hypothetical protein